MTLSTIAFTVSNGDEHKNIITIYFTALNTLLFYLQDVPSILLL